MSMTYVQVQKIAELSLKCRIEHLAERCLSYRLPFT